MSNSEFRIQNSELSVLAGAYNKEEWNTGKRGRNALGREGRVCSACITLAKTQKGPYPLSCQSGADGRSNSPDAFFFAPAGGPVPAAGLLFQRALSLVNCAKYEQRGGQMADYKESDPFYHSARWKRLRKAVLQRDNGMCRDCMDRMRAGIGIKPNRAVMVHHIIPRSERPDLELDMDNLISLCLSCHEERHPERRSKKKRKTLEKIGQHNMRVIKV